jgi:hypothetical protein
LGIHCETRTPLLDPRIIYTSGCDLAMRHPR